MRRGQRWCVVALGVAALLVVPMVARSLPASDRDLSAAELLSLVQSSGDEGWSGFVETEGTLQLPDADRFSTVAGLFGERTRMRAWWRSTDHWRVDRLLVSGENDLFHDEALTTEWDYEDLDATVSRDPRIRLPRTADLLPPALARRFLEDRSALRAERIEPRRVAGVDAVGLRVTPRGDVSSIERVDLWADPDTGVPLRVEVYAAGRAAFTSAFSDFTAEPPVAASVTFDPPPGVKVSFDDVLDIADAANQYAPVLPPDTAAGLPKTTDSDRAVGVYGHGMTQLIAIPLRDREADALRDQLKVTPGMRTVPVGRLVTVAPLAVVITGKQGDGGWLLAGTVTEATLQQAATDVVEGFQFTEDLGD